MAKKEKDVEQKNGGLSADIDFGALVQKIKAGRGPKMPSKTTMNLAITEKAEGTKNTNIIIAIVCVIGVVLFAKFGIWDVIQKEKAAQAEVDAVQEQVDQNTATLARYEKVAKKYSHFYYAFLSDEELKIMDRIELLDILGTELFSEAAMKSVNVKDNMATLEFNDVTLEQLGVLADKLSQNEFVKNVDVNTTATYEDDGAGNLNKVIQGNVVVLFDNGYTPVASTESTEEGAGS